MPGYLEVVDASRWVPVNPTGKTQPTQLRRPPRKSLRALKKDAMGVELPRSLKSVMLPSIGFVPLAGPTGTRPCRSETWQGGMLSASFTSCPAVLESLNGVGAIISTHLKKISYSKIQCQTISTFLGAPRCISIYFNESSQHSTSSPFSQSMQSKVMTDSSLGPGTFEAFASAVAHVAL